MTISQPLAQIQSQPKPANCDRRILLFDLSVGGHHPAYIQHLIRYWGEQNCCRPQISATASGCSGNRRILWKRSRQVRPHYRG
jgi:hypothetical protein